MVDRERPNTMPPLPPSNFNRDELLRWFQQQTISFQKVITGSLQAGQEIQSANFASGSAGWQIDGDGNAEFNDVTIRGDLISSNWDGADPLDLSGSYLTAYDATATEGYAFDSSAGVGQITGTLYIGPNDDGHLIGLNPNQIDDFITLDFFLDGDLAADLVASSVGDPISSWHVYTTGGGEAAKIDLRSDFIILDSVDGQIGLARNGTASAPALSWTGDADTGIYLSSAGVMRLVTGGTDSISMGANVSIATGTTGSAANVNIGTGSGLQTLLRSTSALKYKSDLSDADYLADIELAPKKFYREDDDRHYYGFIADYLGEQDDLLGEYSDGEIENYDQRAVMAVMAAKINRLEERVLK